MNKHTKMNSRNSEHLLGRFLLILLLGACSFWNTVEGGAIEGSVRNNSGIMNLITPAPRLLMAPPPPAVLVATPDTGTVNGYNGNASLLNVLSNDSVDGLPATADALVITVLVAPSNNKISLNTTTGSVSVDPGIASGNYSFTYQICDTGNLSNCLTATVLVQVTSPPILANHDDMTVNSYNGNLNLGNVLTNDLLNGTGVTISRINLSIVTPASDPAVILNTSNGRVSVFPMTPAGSYTIVYRICDTLNTSNCDTSIVYINVTPPPIVADPDEGTVNGYNGNTNLINVFANDKLNGNATFVTSVNLSVVTGSGHPGVTLNTTTGYVGVDPGTIAGTYTIVYQICDTLNTSNCDTALVTVLVTVPAIFGNADLANVNGYDGNATLINVLSNDQLNGGSVTAGRVSLTLVTPASNPLIDLDTITGIISVSPIVPAGTYTLVYQICDTLNTTNCDTALVEILVGAPLVKADPDQGTVNGYNGSVNVMNVFANDSLNQLPTQSGPVLVTLVTPASDSKITLDTATGIIAVTAPVLAGTYTMVYRICDSVNTTNCDTALVEVIVTAPFILATDDNTSINGYTGGTNLVDVLANDSINGMPVGPGGVSLSLAIPASNPGVTLNLTSGMVNVAALTPAGNYTIQYKICDTLNTGNCDTGLVSILVTAPLIQAVADTFSGNGYDAATLGNVLLNDSLNSMVLPTSSANLSIITPASHTGVSLNLTNGNIVLNPRVPAGDYTIQYRICDTLNPSNCDSASVLIRVSAPDIMAVNDTGTVNNYFGSTGLLNVLLNDSLNHNSLMAGDVKITILTGSGHAGVWLNDTTGIVKVNPYVPVGNYTIRYKVCDTINVSNCDSAEAFIQVQPPAILAIDDSASADGYYGDTLVLNIWDNDLFNGDTASAINVTTTITLLASHPGITINDTTGVVSVAPGVPAGIYTLVYEIRDTFNTGSFDTAVVKINVLAPIILATNDTVMVNGYNGGSALVNVLTNDTVAGVAATSVNTRMHIWIPATNLDVVLDTTDGMVHVNPGVPSGFFYIHYVISDTINWSNTDTAVVVIQVTAPPIQGNADEVTVEGYNGNLNLMNVLANDTLNGVVIPPGGARITLVSPPSNQNIVLSTVSGRLSVFPGTFAATYQFVYRICDTLNPINCDTALVTVRVLAPQIIATNDTVSVGGYFGQMGVVDVLLNDSIHNQVASLPGVTITVLTPASHSGVMLDTTTGKLDVMPQTPAGIYFVEYRIADTLNPTNSDTAWIRVTITPPTLIAVNDTGTASSYLGSPFVLNTFHNDRLDGMLLNGDMVKTTILVPFSHSGIVFDTLTGLVSVLPMTPAGTYFLLYQVCDTANVGNCKTAWIRIDVLSIPIMAYADSGLANGYTGLPVATNVLLNDSINGVPVTPGSVTLSVVIGSGSTGVVLDTITGNVSVEPKTAAGTYFITYTICDPLSPGVCSNALVTIQVFAIPPIAIPDTGFGFEHLPIVIRPLLNDFDPDGNLNPYSLRITTPPMHGTAVVDTLLGTITYIGDTLWSGIDTLYYTVCDSGMVPTSCGFSFVVIGVLGELRGTILGSTILTCFGDTNGTATVMASGGIPPYTYSWNTVPVQTGPTAINLRAGSYVVTIMDSIGQVLPLNVNITQASTLTATHTTEMPICYAGSSGKIDLTPAGGLPPYRFLWNTGHILEDITGLAAGNYSVRITDTAGCQIVRSVTLSQPTPIVTSAIEIHDVICKDQTEGYIITAVTGGFAPYKYLWSTGDTLANIFKRPNGNYTIAVTDSLGCTKETVFTINFERSDCEQKVFIPQGFSPDGDGINDALFIEGILNYPNNYLQVFNRWGSKVFEANGYKNDWNGDVKLGTVIGSDDGRLPTGTYFYVLTLEPGKPAITGYFFISKN